MQKFLLPRKVSNLVNNFLHRELELGILPKVSSDRVTKSSNPKSYDLIKWFSIKNISYGNPNAERYGDCLLSDNNLVVVAGHQPAAFGGPLMILIKAIGVVKYAEFISKKYGVKAVPVFWVAAEDHDLKEAFNYCYIKNESCIKLPYLRENSNLPLAYITVREEEESIAQTVSPEITRFYIKKSRFTEAFLKLICWYLRDYSPFFIDASDTFLKSTLGDLLSFALDNIAEINDAILERIAQLNCLGFKERIRWKPNFTPFFYFGSKGRERVHMLDDGRFYFTLSKETVSKRDFISILKTNPTAISYSAIFRPIVQDYILGSPTVNLLGDAEMEYFIESSVLFNIFSLDTPVIVPRPHAALLSEDKFGDLLSRYSLEELVNKDFLTPELKRVSDLLGIVKGEILNSFDKLEPVIEGSDKGLYKKFYKTKDKIEEVLTAFFRKIMNEKRNKSKEGRLVLQLLNTLFPYGVAQERIVLWVSLPFTDIKEVVMREMDFIDDWQILLV